MATKPIGWMAAASLGCWLAVSAAVGLQKSGVVFLGMAAPLGVAIASWLLVAREHARAPERTSGLMIKLFAAKMVFFGAWIVAVVLLLPHWTKVFVVSFTSQYILLHVMEAVYLRRLFSGPQHRVTAE